MNAMRCVKKRYYFIGTFMVCLSFACNHMEENKSNVQHIKSDSAIYLENSNPYSPIDKSPMDMSYYPPEYPFLKESGDDTVPLIARVIYSRPKLGGRAIFGDSTKENAVILKYGDNWRMGANETTEIEFFRDVTINGTKLAKGRYVLYCIPYPDKWKIVFNSNLFAWGRVINPNKDIFNTVVPVITTSHPIEYFTMVFEKGQQGADLLMLWGNLKVVLPINF